MRRRFDRILSWAPDWCLARLGSRSAQWLCSHLLSTRLITIRSVNVDDLIAEAWSAVQKAGVPEPLQEVAFKEAIGFLRVAVAGADSMTMKTGATSSHERATTDKSPVAHGASEHPSEEAFFEALAHEAEVSESDLRDILSLTRDGNVHVTQPTKKLGGTLSAQARTVIALVASARAVGLGEKPVSADAVRRELDRKRCYDAGNFAAKHLGPLKGFNAGASRNEIVLTSKWAEDFAAAVAQAHGRATDESRG